MNVRCALWEIFIMWGMFVCVLCSPPTNLFWIFPKNERWQKDGEIAVNGLQCARCKRLTDFPDVSSKINISESITWIQKKKNPRLHNSNLTALRITSTWVIFYRRMAAVIMYRHPHPTPQKTQTNSTQNWSICLIQGGKWKGFSQWLLLSRSCNWEFFCI